MYRACTVLGQTILLISGYLIGAWLRANFIILNAKYRSNCLSGKDQGNTEIDNFKGSELVFVGLRCTSKINPQTAILYKNWAKSVSGLLVVFVHRKNKNLSKDIEVVQLDVSPNSGVEIQSLLTLQYIIEHYLLRFKWFMVTDTNYFINVKKLSFLKHLDHSEDILLIPENGGTIDNNLLDAGRIFSHSLLTKTSYSLRHCSKRFSENEKIYKCLRNKFNIGTSEETGENEVKEYSFSGCEQLIEQPSDIIVENLTKNRPCIYRLQVSLLRRKLLYHSQKTTKLKHATKNNSNRLSQTIHERRREKTKFNNKTHLHFMFKIHTLYKLGRNPSSSVRQRGIKNGIQKIIDEGIEKLRISHGSEFISFRALSYGYSYINPVEEASYITDIFTSDIERHVVRSTQKFGQIESTILDNETRKVVNIVVPLGGKLEIFKKFMKNLEVNILQKNDNFVSLLIVYFPEGQSPQEHLKVFETYKTKYVGITFNWCNVTGRFARARALQTGTEFHGQGSLLFFADVDLNFNTDFLQRCRINTVAKKQVYFPAMFKHFNPKIGNTTTPVKDYFRSFQGSVGDWAIFSFGPACAYREDILAIGGFNVQLGQWGFEDIQFYEQFIEAKYDVIRSPDPGLVHAYHRHTNCDVIVNMVQRKMCKASRIGGVASQKSVFNYLLKKQYLTLTTGV